MQFVVDASIRTGTLSVKVNAQMYKLELWVDILVLHVEHRVTEWVSECLNHHNHHI